MSNLERINFFATTTVNNKTLFETAMIYATNKKSHGKEIDDNNNNNDNNS